VKAILHNINLFINSRPNPHPPTQNTNKPTYTCQPIQVPKKKFPSPPLLKTLFHVLPPLPISEDTSGRIEDAGSKSSSSSSDCAALRDRGEGVREMSTNGTPGCSSEKLFFELWLALEVGPSMSAARCSTSSSGSSSELSRRWRFTDGSDLRLRDNARY